MTTKTRSSRRLRWTDFDDETLLGQRFRDLRLRLEDGPLGADVEHLYHELERRGIRFRPHVWLSTEWFSPDGVPGIAAPYFAAHPRLARLERRLTGEVEGGSRKWRRRILRHEAGHAIDTAYGLRRRADWRQMFGHASKPYPKHYSARPGSRRYVLHLGHWYAQSHPTEDFAETFAVWLQPKATWRREYAGWPALEKLEYVDELMTEIAGCTPRRRDRSVVAALSDNQRSLLEHYRRKQTVADRPGRYDARLRRVFAVRAGDPETEPASRFIRELEPQLRRALTRRSRISRYLVDHVIATVRQRTRQLDLGLRQPRRESRRAVLGLLEHVAADLLLRNRENYVL